MSGMEMIEDEDEEGSADMRKKRNTNENRHRNGKSKQTGTRLNGWRVLAANYMLETGMEEEIFTVLCGGSERRFRGGRCTVCAPGLQGQGQRVNEDVEMECVGGRPMGKQFSTILYWPCCEYHTNDACQTLRPPRHLSIQTLLQ